MSELERTFHQLFTDRDFKVQGTIMFIDMVGSTKYKNDNSEASWLPNFGTFFDVITEEIKPEEFGRVVKLLGDGVMVYYGKDYAVNAINSAIRIQEKLERMRRDNTIMNCHFSIGIAFGPIVEFSMGNGSKDYIGNVVDKAARLCAVGKEDTILADHATIAGSLLHNIKGQYGNANSWGEKDYIGEEQKIRLKGFPNPIPYYLIRWIDRDFGLEPKAVTEGVEEELNKSKAKTVVSDKPRKESGRVATWKRSEKTKRFFGFAQNQVNESFFIHEMSLIDRDKLEPGDIVYFTAYSTPRNPNSSDSNSNPADQARAVITDGQRLCGEVVTVRQDKGFGFVQVKDSRANPHDLYFRIPGGMEIHRGEKVYFTVTRGFKGGAAQAVDITKEEDEKKE